MHQAAQRTSSRYARNAQDGASWLSRAATAVSASLDLLNRARTLVVQGADAGALSREDHETREALAVELEAVTEALAAQANTTFLGRSVFAGTADGPAFTETAPGRFAFTVTTGTVERRVGASTTVRVDTDGGLVFGTGSDPAGTDPTIFAVLTGVAETLRSGGDVRADLAAIDTRLEAMLSQAASIGVRTTQLTVALDRLADAIMNLTSEVYEVSGNSDASGGGVEDVDLSATITELKLQEVHYEAALGATARTLQASLLDYLK